MPRILATLCAVSLFTAAAFAQPQDAPVERIEVELARPQDPPARVDVESAQQLYEVSDQMKLLTGDELIRFAGHEPENVTFLGVTTGEVPEVLRHHLDLANAAGLMIEHVVPDSPADKAGLKQYDVIEKLGDQLLVNAEQLATLIRGHKAGDEVELTVHREGEAIKVTATLDQRQNEQTFLWLEGRGPHLDRLREMIDQLRTNLREGDGPLDRETLQQQVDRLREEINRMREQGESGLRMRVFPRPGGPRPWHEHPEAPRAPGAPQAPRPPQPPMAPGGIGAEGDAQSITVRSRDPEHVLELTIEGGEKTLRVESADEDTVIFEGPVNTPEERERVPGDLRRKLTRLEQAFERGPAPGRLGPGPGPGPGPGRPPGLPGMRPPGPRGGEPR